MKITAQKIAVLNGHKDSIYALWAGNGNELYSSGGDGQIVKWDINDPTRPGKLIAQVPSPVYSLAFFPEKNILVAGTRLGSLYTFSLGAGKKSQLELGSEIFTIQSVDGDFLFAGTGKGHFYKLNIEANTITHENAFSDKSCRSIAINKENIIATGWSDHYIRILDAGGLKLLHSFEAHTSSVFSIAYTPSGNYLISGGRDAQLKVWDTADYSLFLSIPAHLFTINCICISKELGLFATASRDKTVKIWDLESFELLKVLNIEKSAGHTHSVNTLLWAEDLLISAGDDRLINLWKIGK